MAESAHIEHKKVELVELFFDLVLVYAISQTTGLIHHLHGGVLDPISILSFVVAYVIIVNAWMYQVIFTNRYGSNSPRDVAFSLITMALLLFLSNTITDDWEGTFVPFSVTLGLIFAVQMLQYIAAYASEHDADGRFLIRGFLLLTGIYAATLFLGSAMPYRIGVFITAAGLITNVLLPLRFMRRLNRIPLNFPHLVERLTLLVIITFGEMVVGIAPWFTPDTLSISSVIVFAIAAGLFVHYVWVFDRMIDLSTSGHGASRLQYAHVPIFLGLGMVTVSLAFFGEEEANLLFATAFCYVGMLLFYAGIFASRTYVAEYVRPTRPVLIIQAIIYACAFACAVALNGWVLAVLAVTALAVWAECASMAVMYRTGRDASTNIADGAGGTEGARDE